MGKSIRTVILRVVYVIVALFGLSMVIKGSRAALAQASVASRFGDAGMAGGSFNPMQWMLYAMILFGVVLLYVALRLWWGLEHEQEP